MNLQRLVRVSLIAGLTYLSLMQFPEVFNLVLSFAAGFGIFALLSPLWSFFRFVRLPCAVLKVDGHEWRYRYKQRGVKGGILYQSVSGGQQDMNRIIAFSTKEATFPENVVFGFLSPPSPLVLATLTIGERTFEFSMNKAKARCSCPTPIPHWTATTYAGLFVKEDEEEKWKGAAILVVLDSGEKKKAPKKKPKQREKWSWWPRPEFNPT